MKLWLKISLICTAVLLVVVGVCSTLLLLVSRDKVLSLTVENVKAEQDNLTSSFRQMMTLYGRNDLGRLEARSLALYCFRQFTGETSVLTMDGETVYSNLVFDPGRSLSLTDTGVPSDCFATVNGTHVVIVGSGTNVLSHQFSIYTVQDITNVYGDISQLVWRFGVIILTCIMAGVVLIIALILYAMQPVKELSRSVRRIARGEYAQRAPVVSNDEIGELARDFNSMAGAVQAHVEELKDVAQRQQLFIGGLTHEFKTPLTSVIGHAETLLYTKMPPDAAENSLLTIHEQCKWLERLTQKLLKLVTLQEDLEIKEEPVEPLMEAVRAGTAETLQQRGVLLETVSGEGTLPMDFDLMLSLLINLVDNASKASSPGQTVTLRTYGRTIEMEDRGAGIPAEELSRVMEPFYMVDKSRSKKMGGTGLGLALARRIAEAHGAQIRIVSEQDRGTTVRVLFPDNKTFTNP
jgi:signal transduction histidine kinase